MFNLNAKVWTCFFRVEVRYLAHKGEGRAEQTARRKEERQKLKDAGFKETEFKFRSDATPRQKSLAKAQATALAKRITAKTGVEVSVVEGSFL